MKKIVIEFNEELNQWEVCIDSDKPIWKSKVLSRLIRTFLKYLKEWEDNNGSK